MVRGMRGGGVMAHVVHGDEPAEIARATQDTVDVAGDAADQAERLSMVMEAEAIHAALHGGSGEGSLEGYDFPLEDTEDVLAMEGAEDASDDPMHAGGLDPAPWLPAEQAAMHIIDPSNPDDPGASLTPEDETLLGIDPYE
jgi:hypothetical protein